MAQYPNEQKIRNEEIRASFLSKKKKKKNKTQEKMILNFCCYPAIYHQLIHHIIGYSSHQICNNFFHLSENINRL